MSRLYSLYGGAIYGIVYRIIQREDIAKEALQDCFVRIWQKIDLYEESKGRPFTWMAHLARNIALDKLKSSEISKGRKTDSIDVVVHPPEGNQLTETINTDVIGLNKVSNLLREEERMVIDYLYFRGFTQRELADETGIPLGTVKTRLRMAIKNLRKALSVDQ